MLARNSSCATPQKTLPKPKHKGLNVDQNLSKSLCSACFSNFLRRLFRPIVEIACHKTFALRVLLPFLVDFVLVRGGVVIPKPNDFLDLLEALQQVVQWLPGLEPRQR